MKITIDIPDADIAAAVARMNSAAPGPAATPPLKPAAPAPVVGLYAMAWENTRDKAGALVYPLSAIPAGVGVVNLFGTRPGKKGDLPVHAGDPAPGGWETFDNVGPGSYWMPNLGEEQVSPASVQALRARGVSVRLAIGGSSNGFCYRTMVQGQALLDAIDVMAKGLGGIDGVLFDNFEGGVGSDPAIMVLIARTLKASYGPGFAITLAPAPADTAIAVALNAAGLLESVSPQFYDNRTFLPPNAVADWIDKWCALIPASRVVVGQSHNYKVGTGAPDESLSLAMWLREMSTIKARQPDIRGCVAWTARSVIDDGGKWVTAMRAIVGKA